MPNIVLTVYLKETNGNYAEYSKSEESKKKYNSIARTAMKEALDVAGIIEEKDIFDDIAEEPKEIPDDVKDIIEERPFPIDKDASIKGLYEVASKGKGFFSRFKRK